MVNDLTWLLNHVSSSPAFSPFVIISGDHNTDNFDRGSLLRIPFLRYSEALHDRIQTYLTNQVLTIRFHLLSQCPCLPPMRVVQNVPPCLHRTTYHTLSVARAMYRPSNGIHAVGPMKPLGSKDEPGTVKQSRNLRGRGLLVECASTAKEYIEQLQRPKSIWHIRSTSTEIRTFPSPWTIKN